MVRPVVDLMASKLAARGYYWQLWELAVTTLNKFVVIGATGFGDGNISAFLIFSCDDFLSQEEEEERRELTTRVL